VVVGASAGGVEALIAFVASLPPDLPATVLVVLHVSATGPSVLPAILERACRLPVITAIDGAPLLAGEIQVAPPDHHLLVEDLHVALAQTPRENGHRPAIDPTMRSAAAVFGAATTGVVLSGARDDGTAGLLAIKASGGAAIAQDPDEAVYPSMPQSAIDHVQVDAVLPVARMGEWLRSLRASGEREGGPAASMAGIDPIPAATPPGRGTRYTCPDCGGALFADEDDKLPRFRCSVGHVFSIESLASAQAATLESALWAAVRSLEDRAHLLRRMATRYGEEPRARRLDEEAREALARAEVIRATIQRPQGGRARLEEPAV
jgi:two-component system, chemotaxis family, protein-glutamate methylesterase/glutaminase